jgi:uncharacterized membrane protein
MTAPDGHNRANSPPAVVTGDEAEMQKLRAAIETTRAELSGTLEALQDRLAPARLTERAKALAREATVGRAEAAATDLRDRLRAVGPRVRETAGGITLPTLTIAGHMLQPQLIDAPAILLPCSLALDLLQRRSGNRFYAKAAYGTLLGGFIGEVVAGAAGAADSRTGASSPEAKRTATLYGLVNAGVLVLTGLNLALRRGKRRPTGLLALPGLDRTLRRRKETPTGPTPLVLSLIGTLGLAVSVWRGHQLVHHQDLPDTDVDPAAAATASSPPGDAGITGGAVPGTDARNRVNGPPLQGTPPS